MLDMSLALSAMICFLIRFIFKLLCKNISPIISDDRLFATKLSEQKISARTDMQSDACTPSSQAVCSGVVCGACGVWCMWCCVHVVHMVRCACGAVCGVRSAYCVHVVSMHAGCVRCTCSVRVV